MSVKDLRSRYPIAVAWPRSAMDLARVDAIAIHHSVTPTLSANASEAEEIAWLDKIHAYHVSQGFGGIGYHLCCFPSGRAYYVASLRQWGANVGGQNNHLYGVCLVGTFTTAPAPQQQLVGAALCVDFIDKFLKRKVALRPHLYWGGTACPGKVEGQIGSIRGLIPLPPPAGIWAEVKPVSKSVVLYRATNLVNLETGGAVKLLPEGTKLDVAAQYRTTHYLTPYSYSRKIPNGFAISATVPPPSCTAERRRIAELEAALKARTAERDALKGQVASLTNQVNAFNEKLQAIKRIVG